MRMEVKEIPCGQVRTMLHRSTARIGSPQFTCLRAKRSSKTMARSRSETGSPCLCPHPSIRVGTKPRESDVQYWIHCKSAPTIPRPSTSRTTPSWKSSKALQYTKPNPCRCPSLRLRPSSRASPLQQTCQHLPDQPLRITTVSVAYHLERAPVRFQAVGLLRQNPTRARVPRSTSPLASRKESKHLQTRLTESRLHK